MRGKLKNFMLFSLIFRNIPAYAGKTQQHHWPPLWCREHPRVCGENAFWCPRRRLGRGTSPRMRGKRLRRPRACVWRRNIPAYAGKTHHRGNSGSYQPEHPRVCGENFLARYLTITVGGTSPRMRGKRTSSDAVAGTRRNIPAYAGKTASRRLPGAPTAEHPRVCGENLSLRSDDFWMCGTSPRMRGKPDDDIIEAVQKRNIPAYAGKTAPRNQQASYRPEHPRVCGENVQCLRQTLQGRGTSPRMRGKPLLTCGSSFLKVILHSVLFFCTVGVPWNPLQLPPF